MTLLQIVMLSPGIHLLKIMSPCPEPVKEKKMSLKLKMLGLLCNQIVNLKTDSETLYYSIIKLKYSPSILQHNNGLKNYASLNKSHNNCHRN